ncbi:MAG TPA: rhomboid family intramembrane serine protease [Chitinophagales bacterium]|nr:rhomboid family intramembrane serine protease [Chitinophagales bacterium]
MSITLLIIILTCIVSIAAFNNQHMMQQLIFSPYIIKRKGEWFRFVSSGLLHINFLHLFFNMYALYLFGGITEAYFKNMFRPVGATLYMFMYLLAIALSEAYSYFKHQDNPSYASLGASGAVSAVVFASILFEPLNKIGLIFFPVGIPGFIFGLLYLLYSMYMAKQASDNIGHYAHFYGAVFGFIFPITMKPSLFENFLAQVTNGY